MKRYYSCWIPYEDMRPPNGFPTTLGFIFIGGRPFTKIALVRPAQDDPNEACFKLTWSVIKRDEDDMLLYANGKCYRCEVSDPPVEEDWTSQLGCMEWRQDMLASGFGVEKFPEIAPYLES